MTTRRVVVPFFVLVAVVASGCRVARTMPEADAATPGERVVALTFDDGPSAHTNAVLDVLARHKVTATFFVTGSQAERYPWLMARIAMDGHRVGNHTWNHPRLTQLSDAQIRSQLRNTQNVIARTTGQSSVCVRPPYGEHNARVNNVIREFGRSYTMLWSIDTNDWQRPAPATITSRVVNNLRPGAVILMHDGGGNRANTVAALDSMIRRIHAAGYKIRPVC